MYQFFPYIRFSVFSFVLLVSLAFYGFRFRRNPGVKEFLVAISGAAWCVFCQAFELMATVLPVKIFWADLEYLGSMIAAPAYLSMALRFAGQEQYLKKKYVFLVAALFFLFFLLIITDSFHGLMRSNFSLDASAVPFTVQKNYGPLYPLYLLFLYIILTASVLLLLNVLQKKNTIFRKPALSLLLFLLIVTIPNALYYFHLMPVKRFDLSTAFLGPAALILAWGIFQHKLLNITPIARDLLIEKMDNGILVLDAEDTVIDLNDAMAGILEIEKKSLTGKDSALIPDLYVVIREEKKEDEVNYFRMEKTDGIHTYEVRKHQITGKNAEKTGVLIVLNDITEQLKNMEQIINQQRALSVMQEREHLGRELHDGLGQMFGYINVQAQTVKEYLIKNNLPAAEQKLEDLINISRDAHGDVREYILEMRGAVSRNRCFSAALKHYATEFEERYHIPVEVHFGEGFTEDFPETQNAENILRIIQEAMNNIRKHAGECRARISFIKEDGVTRISVCDNGKGFDHSSQPEASVHCFGLDIMQNRAKEMGGSFEILSEKGQGTEVVIQIKDGAANANRNSR